MSETIGQLMKETEQQRDPLESLENIQQLIADGGEITIGPMAGIACVATAVDDSNCLAMLQRRRNESLYQLLLRLDFAIDEALKEGGIIDEINSISQ